MAEHECFWKRVAQQLVVENDRLEVQVHRLKEQLRATQAAAVALAEIEEQVNPVAMSERGPLWGRTQDT